MSTHTYTNTQTQKERRGEGREGNEGVDATSTKKISTTSGNRKEQDSAAGQRRLATDREERPTHT